MLAGRGLRRGDNQAAADQAIRCHGGVGNHGRCDVGAVDGATHVRGPSPRTTLTALRQCRAPALSLRRTQCAPPNTLLRALPGKDCRLPSRRPAPQTNLFAPPVRRLSDGATRYAHGPTAKLGISMAVSMEVQPRLKLCILAGQTANMRSFSPVIIFSVPAASQVRGLNGSPLPALTLRRHSSGCLSSGAAGVRTYLNQPNR